MEASNEIPVDKDECSGCHRRAAADDEGFKCCSKCKLAYYCSKDCQVSHWKSHKANCKRVTEAKKLASKNHQKREFKLLQEWKRQVKNGGILPFMMINFFGWNVLSRLEEEQSVVLLNLVFDYNKRNFVPKSEPAIARIDDIETDGQLGQELQLVQELREAYASMPSHAANQCTILILSVVEGMTVGNVIPYLLERPTSPLTRASWRELQELLNDVTLQSSKFTSWPHLLQQNLRSSINNSVRHSIHFQPFLASALWIESNKSRHKTHIVTFDMTMGHGLGEIKSLDSYSVRSVAWVSSRLQEEGLLTAENRQLLDLENNPQLLQSRIQHPNNILMPVFFYCSRTKVGIVSPNLMEVSPNHVNYSTKQCDKKAKAAFQKLQTIPFPPVQSPELH